MKESILHYIWQQKLFYNSNLQTIDGEKVEVIDVGKLNTDGGPDFFNAKIKIGETLWAGNIEIHTLASDWKKHNHDVDKLYDSVILHVVKKADTEIQRTDGERIPQLELKYPLEIEENYETLISEKKWIACADKIADVPQIFIESWKNALLAERLNTKTNHISDSLHENKQHWEEVFYIVLARSFGFGTNSQAFEQVAKSLPLSVLGKHKNDLFQIEALLFGQAGLLEVKCTDEYFLKLRQEYAFLQKKYELKPIESTQWKLLRLRPDNFPHIRLTQFAAIIHVSSKLLSKIIEKPEINYLVTLFKCEPSEYWQTHYLFGENSDTRRKILGKNSIESLMINTVIPFVFYYAQHNGNETLKEKAIQLLETIRAEQNIITKNWQSLGIVINTAYDSQAFLQLKKQYCDEKKCLFCRIGHKVLTKNAASGK